METSREESLRFFGINQAESIAWKENRDLVENKASKSIGVLYNEVIIFTIHSYINQEIIT